MPATQQSAPSNQALQQQMTPATERPSALDLDLDLAQAQEVRTGEPGQLLGGGPEATAFEDKFNREFARQLHVFGVSADEAADRGPALGPGQLGGASGDDLTQEDLDELFTPVQQDLLEGFCDNHAIPDRLFNGDEVGGSSAPQRLMLAGHMLSTGSYRPGSFAQAVHARMCGHWINLVNHYAGVSQGNRGGIRENFDHTGHLSISVGDTVDETTGEHDLGLARHGEFDGISRRHRSTEEEAIADGEGASEHVAFRSENLPASRLDSLEPGDWLYIFNDTGVDGHRSGGGNHSVIFSRYASNWETGPEGQAYRRIVCMSQITASAGGREETRLIGPHYTHLGEHRITPVTKVTRPNESARPVRNAEELAAALGTGPEARHNERFIAGKLGPRGGQFDFDTLSADLRAQNQTMLTELAAGMDGQRMTPMQRQAFTDLNTEARAPESAQTIGTMVRLNQKLTHLVASARVMDAGSEASHEGVESRREASSERAAPQIARQWRTMHVFDTRVHGWVGEELASARGLIEEHELAQIRGRCDAAERSLSTWWNQRNALPEVPQEDFEARRRQADDAERQLNTDREELWDTIVAAQIARRMPNPYRRQHRRAARNLAILPDRRVDPERELRAAAGAAGYHTANVTQGPAARRVFQGAGQVIDGQLANLTLTPDWSGYITRD